MPGTSDNHASGIFVVKKDYQDFLDVIFVFNKTDALSINIGSIQESGVRSQNSEFRRQKKKVNYIITIRLLFICNKE